MAWVDEQHWCSILDGGIGGVCRSVRRFCSRGLCLALLLIPAAARKLEGVGWVPGRFNLAFPSAVPHPGTRDPGVATRAHETFQSPSCDNRTWQAPRRGDNVSPIVKACVDPPAPARSHVASRKTMMEIQCLVHSDDCQRKRVIFHRLPRPKGTRIVTVWNPMRPYEGLDRPTYSWNVSPAHDGRYGRRLVSLVRLITRRCRSQVSQASRLSPPSLFSDLTLPISSRSRCLVPSLGN